MKEDFKKLLIAIMSSPDGDSIRNAIYESYRYLNDKQLGVLPKFINADSLYTKEILDMTEEMNKILLTMPPEQASEIMQSEELSSLIEILHDKNIMHNAYGYFTSKGHISPSGSPDNPDDILADFQSLHHVETITNTYHFATARGKQTIDGRKPADTDPKQVGPVGLASIYIGDKTSVSVTFNAHSMPVIGILTNTLVLWNENMGVREFMEQAFDEIVPFDDTTFAIRPNVAYIAEDNSYPSTDRTIVVGKNLLDGSTVRNLYIGIGDQPYVPNAKIYATCDVTVTMTYDNFNIRGLKVN